MKNSMALPNVEVRKCSAPRCKKDAVAHCTFGSKIKGEPALFAGPLCLDCAGKYQTKYVGA